MTTMAQNNVHQCSCKNIELNTQEEQTCQKCQALNRPTQNLTCSECEGDTSSQPCSLKTPQLKCSKCEGRGCAEEVTATSVSNSPHPTICPKCGSDRKEQGSAPSDPPKGRSRFLNALGVGCVAAVGSVVAVAAAPVVLTAVGFTSGGIAAGSMAASMMSSAAVANGGGIAAGSLVAVLQSAGAAGIGTAGTAAAGAAGAAAGGLMGGVGFVLKNLFTKTSKDSGNGKNSSNDDHGT